MKRNRWILTALLVAYLGIHNGYLALFTDNESDPIITYPLPVQMLPAADQQKLYSGIAIRDHLHLAHLLEDFLS